MSEWKIDKGVPVPSRRERTKFPWNDMEHGDSILVPGDRGRSACWAAKVWLSRHRPDLRVVSRTEGDGVRIWFLRREVTP